MASLCVSVFCSHTSPEACFLSPSPPGRRTAFRLFPHSIPHPQRGVHHVGYQLVQLHQPLEQEDIFHHWEAQSQGVSAPRVPLCGFWGILAFSHFPPAGGQRWGHLPVENHWPCGQGMTC